MSLSAEPAAGRVIVIGAVNMDLSGTPASALRSGDSNPGRVVMTPGGVGRNIAENLSRLGRAVSLVTVTGRDAYGRVIRQDCKKAGIDLSLSFVEPKARTSTYLCVNEHNGDLHTAVADMAIYETLTPERLEPLLPALNQAMLVIADANLPEETVGWISRQVAAPLAADPVSAAKVSRLRGILPRLEMLKPNLQEAELLTGISVHGDGDLLRVSSALRTLGVRRVFLSLGARGVWADDGVFRALLPCFPGPIVNTTGCGDAFLAAAADAWLDGAGMEESARRALAAAAHCAADAHSVSPTLSRKALERILL